MGETFLVVESEVTTKSPKAMDQQYEVHNQAIVPEPSGADAHSAAVSSLQTPYVTVTSRVGDEAVHVWVNAAARPEAELAARLNRLFGANDLPEEDSTKP